jgi:hypothetical protein
VYSHPSCSICQHPDRNTIDCRLVDRHKLSAICRDYPNLNYQALRRHRERHLKLNLAALSPAKQREAADQLRDYAITTKSSRIAILQDLVNRHIALMEARAAAADPNDAAARTGLIGRDGLYDHRLNVEIRATLEQAAKEMQDWDPAGAIAYARANRAAEAVQGGSIQMIQVIGGSAESAIAGPVPVRPIREIMFGRPDIQRSLQSVGDDPPLSGAAGPAGGSEPGE